MQSKIFNTVKYVTAFFIILFSSSFVNNFGVDSFEIHLGNKVLIKEYVTQHVALKTITLNKENINEQMTVYYNHCRQIGKSRAISLLDANGKKIKQWKFQDASESNSGMVIPVKDILSAFDKSGNSLALYYSSQLIPQGRLLTTLNSFVNTTA